MSDEGYPGSKGGSGVRQRIISMMPAHVHYFEPFVGRGAILRCKLPAPGHNVGCDVDAGVIEWWRRLRPAPSNLTILQEDALRALSSIPEMQDPNTLVYLDPPYLITTRTRLFYPHEFATPRQHRRLLLAAAKLPCMVMISGYASELYSDLLDDWRVERFRAMTRGGIRLEHVWMNFPTDLPLHDVRFVGDGFRERDRIKKKRLRWTSRLLRMPAAERQVLCEALAILDRPSTKMALRSATPEMVIAAANAENGDGRRDRRMVRCAN